MGYTKLAVRGLSWITLLRFSTRFITILRLAVLGRLLTPAQFGFFGIASLLLSLLEILTETGINVFLVQEKSHIREYVSSAWVVSLMRGFLLALLIFITAGPIARFFNSPDSQSVIALTAIVPLIRGFINPAIIIYQKELLFAKEFKLRFILFLTDVTFSIIVGFITKSAISFVYGLIASAVLEVVLSYVLIRIWPQLHFEATKIKTVIKRGGWVTLTGIFAYFADNGDNLTVGKILGSSSLGIYQIAYKFSTLPISEITMVVNQVIFPVYAKFSEDKIRLKKAFIKVTILSSLGAVILGGGIYLLSSPLIQIFMGPQWDAAIPVIKILAIYGILRTIFGGFAPLFLSVKKQNYVAKMTLFRVGALLLLIIPFVTKFGMVGAGYAMLLSVFIEIPVILYFAKNIFK